MMFRKSFGLVAGALALGVIACGGSDQQQQARNPEVTTTTGATNNQGESSMGMGSSSSTQTGSTGSGSMNPSNEHEMQMQQGTSQMGQSNQMQQNMGMQLSDPQIVAIADSVNKGEVEQAKLAVRKAKDAQVKQFAQMMVTDHEGAMNKTKQLNITPETTQTSTQLQTDSQNAIQSLNGQTGTDFDKAYIDLQVKEHQQVLNDLDQKLIPNAKNAELKKQLTDLRPKIAAHLQQAEQIQQKLGTK
jgi:putative membrane protein